VTESQKKKHLNLLEQIIDVHFGRTAFRVSEFSENLIHHFGYRSIIIYWL